jgi:micrococcal nuclease
MGVLRAALLGWLVLAQVAMPAEAARRDPATAKLAGMPVIETAIVQTARDGNILVLADGREVRLAGIEPPLPPLGHAPDAPWQPLEAAQEALTALAQGQTVSVLGTTGIPDRYGRVAAQVVRQDGVWLEGALLAQGAARVQTTPENPDLATAMLKREANARKRRLGLWQSRFYAVRTPQTLEHDGGSFQIVEATVVTAEDRHGIVWLDLGHGTTARLDRQARARFKAAGLDPVTLAGKRLRLRGWIQWQGRPVLELTHPEAVEHLRGRGGR